MVFLTLLFPPRKMDFLQHLIITIGACILLTALNVNHLTIQILGNRYSVQGVYNAIYIWLFIRTLFHILATFRKNYLKVSPTDVRLATIPLVLLLVPDPGNTEDRLSIISMRGLVLFMGMRTLVKRQFSVLRRIKLVLLAALVFVVAVSLFQLRLVFG